MVVPPAEWGVELLAVSIPTELAVVNAPVHQRVAAQVDVLQPLREGHQHLPVAGLFLPLTCRQHDLTAGCGGRGKGGLMEVAQYILSIHRI